MAGAFEPPNGGSPILPLSRRYFFDVLLATQAEFGVVLSDDQLTRGNVAPLINGLPQPVDSLEALDAADLMLITQKALGTKVF